MAKPIVIERDPTPDERAKILRRYNELADERGRLQGAMCVLPAASRFRRRKLERAMGRVSKEMDILRDIALGDSTTLVTPTRFPSMSVCVAVRAIAPAASHSPRAFDARRSFWR